MGTDIGIAIRAASAGAVVVRDAAGTPFERIDKGAGDVATRVDVAAERAIIDILRAARPDDDIVGEETGRHTGASTGRTWLVDPLCGTANFAAGVQQVAVNVALLEAGTVRAAAVGDPFREEILWTDSRGAWIRTRDGDRAGRPDPGSRLVDVNMDPPFPSAPARRVRQLAILDAFNETFRLRVFSSSLALAWVAIGRQAAYITDRVTSESEHFAAGAALCVAAGCVVTDFDGRPWPSGGLGLIAAADAATHARLIDLVNRSGPS